MYYCDMPESKLLCLSGTVLIVSIAAAGTSAHNCSTQSGLLRLNGTLLFVISTVAADISGHNCEMPESDFSRISGTKAQ